jgi:hypothetical protein
MINSLDNFLMTKILFIKIYLNKLTNPLWKVYKFN